MKKITLLLVGVLATSMTFAGNKNDDSKSASGMAVVHTNFSSYKLIYKSEEATDIKVEIFNSKNERIFSEIIKKSNGFARPYNFESLPEGEYSIRIDNGSNWLTETIEYRPSQIDKLAHVVSLKDGKYLLSLVGQNESPEQFEVDIFNDKGEKLYSGTKSVSGNFAQLFNLKDMNGPFSFEITGKNGSSKTLVK
jgi:hypothetical protein